MTKAFDLIGVDGTSSGWVASIGSSKKRCLSSINFFENLDELLTNYPDSVVVQAENEKAAHLKAYDTHEHLMFVNVTEMDESNVSYHT